MKLIVFLFTGYLILVSCKSNTRVDEIQKNPNVQKNINFNATNEFLKPIGFVNDFDKIFTFQQIEKLEIIISNYEKSTTKEIAIVTIDTITPYTNFKDYCTDLSKKWGVGKKDVDNGLTIVFCKRLRQIRISTGYGTQEILTDEVCQKIIENSMTPEFKKGNYYKGIEGGLMELISEWK